jgi:hypothetical protein
MFYDVEGIMVAKRNIPATEAINTIAIFLRFKIALALVGNRWLPLVKTTL